MRYLLVTLALAPAAAFMLSSPAARAPTARAPSRRFVAPITVDALDDELTASLIRVELADMLDREWIEQDCHQVLGRRAGDAYLSARSAGFNDVGGILQHVGELLMSDSEGFDDAYVGPWDVANFISDVLVACALGDDDRCACSSSPSAAALDARAAELGG
mmetsp:Transcript_25084/g.75301  ORF Transcript_25084/g.75301 Transcript_25084/m.75301 type:complete len:161 (-) Transcript_25084:68-550(-)